MARIFISSTTIDLHEHRAAVVEALRRAGHVVVLFEDTHADGVSAPLGMSRAMIDQSDVLVAIIAWRYGFIPPVDNPDRLSFVELEIRHAWDRRIPTLI